MATEKTSLVIEGKTTGITQATAQLKGLAGAGKQAETATEKLGSAGKKTGATLSSKLLGGAQKVGNFLGGQGTSAASKFLGGLNGIISSVGSLTSLLVIMVAIKVAKWFNDAAKAAAEFAGQMANLATLIPGQTQKLYEYRDSIQSLTVEMGSTQADLAGATYQVVSAFGDQDNVLDILETSAKAASAGLATTTDAVNLLSAVSKGFNDTTTETIDKIADLAFTTVRLGQTTFPELAAAIGQAVPLANSLGVSMEELFAVEATLTGVTGGAAEVTTQMRSAMTALLRPTTELKQLYEEIGVKSGKEFIEVSGGLANALNTIKNAAENSGNEMAAYLGRIEGLVGALALTGAQATNFVYKLEQMENASGALVVAYAEITKGINENGFHIKQLTSAWEVFKTEVGEVILPLKAILAQAFLPLIKVATKVFSVLGGIIKIFAFLIRAAAKITPGMILLKLAFQGIGIILDWLVGGLRWLLQYMQLVATLVGDTLKPIIDELKESFMQLFQPVIDVFSEMFSGVEKLSALEAALWTVHGGIAAVGTAFDFLKFTAISTIEVFQTMGDVFEPLGRFLGHVMRGQFRQAGTAAGEMKDVLAKIPEVIRDNWDSMATSIEGRWDGIGERVKVQAAEIEGAAAILSGEGLGGLTNVGFGGAPDSDAGPGGGAGALDWAMQEDALNSYLQALESMNTGIAVIDRNAEAMAALGIEYDSNEAKAELYNSTMQMLMDSTDATAQDLQIFANVFGELNMELEKTPGLMERFQQAFVDALTNSSKEADNLKIELDKIGESLGNILQGGFIDMFESLGAAWAEGADAGETFKKVIGEIALSILKQLPILFLQAGLNLIAQGQWALGLGFIAASASTALISGYTQSVTGSAQGNVFSGGDTVAFASGGVVGQTTMFPMAGGKTGMMGEAGPEAIMPLSRTANGDLGVRVDSSSSGGTNLKVEINNYSGEDVTTEQESGPDGEVMKVIIGQVVGKQLAEGAYDKPMNNRYGTQPKGY